MRQLFRGAEWLGFLLVFAAASASAQAKWPEFDPTCSDSSKVRTYEQCSLWLTGGGLRQGQPGVPVSSGGEYGAAALSRFVAGERARQAALKYERNARTGGAMWYVGALVTFAGGVMALTHVIPRFPDLAKAGGVTAAGGLATMAIGGGLQALAEREATTAIGLHNGQLIRQQQ